MKKLFLISVLAICTMQVGNARADWAGEMCGTALKAEYQKIVGGYKETYMKDKGTIKATYMTCRENAKKETDKVKKAIAKIDCQIPYTSDKMDAKINYKRDAGFAKATYKQSLCVCSSQPATACSTLFQTLKQRVTDVTNKLGTSKNNKKCKLQAKKALKKGEEAPEC